VRSYCSIANYNNTNKNKLYNAHIVMNHMNRRHGQSQGGRIVDELGYEVRLEVAHETVYGGTILMEVGIEFRVAGEL